MPTRRRTFLPGMAIQYDLVTHVKNLRILIRKQKDLPAVACVSNTPIDLVSDLRTSLC